MEIDYFQLVFALSSIHTGKTSFSFKEPFNLFHLCLRTYLLALNNGASCFSSNDIANLLGQDPGKFAKRYDGGMLEK